MNSDMKDLWKKIVVALSSFGLLSTFGYYLINLENTTLGKKEVVKPRKERIELSRQGTPGDIFGNTVMSTVTKVVDGDTIKVQYSDGKIVTVRMLGIDTPETSRSPRAKLRGTADCFADEATAALESMIGGEQVRLETDPSKDTYDKYGRLLAYVFVGSNNINQQMIQDGFAYEYTYRGERYQYQKEFKTAQENAENSKSGLWGDGVCE